MNVFYASLLSNDKLILDENESHHAVKVLRSVVGDQIMVMDGKGTICIAEITNPHPKKCEFKIISSSLGKKRSFTLHIAIAPTKLNERMEWFLEKATEIGVEEITPVICTRSERRNTNHERFQKVLVAAMKQSMNPWLPVLHEQVDFDKFINTEAPGFIAHCMDLPRTPLSAMDSGLENITVLIGPEGDFTASEIQIATSNKWTPVSLGNSRLRTETAGLVACHTVNMLKELNEK